MSETEISFDVDLRELQGQEGADTLCAFLRAIGSRLGKPVLMTPEGRSQDHPVLGYDPALDKATRVLLQMLWRRRVVRVKILQAGHVERPDVAPDRGR